MFWDPLTPYLPIDGVQGLAVSCPGGQFVEEGTNNLTATQWYGITVVTRSLKHINGSRMSEWVCFSLKSSCQYGHVSA